MEHNTNIFGIKPNNIFINADLWLKFGDFGMAKD